MKVFRMVSVVLFAVLALSMISGASAAQPTINTKHMNVHVNEKFGFNLGSNPSTGYSWIPVYNTKYVKGVSATFTPNKNPNIVGAPGVEHFVFKPIKKGETTIILKYLQTWDKKNPAKIIILHLKIT